MSKSKVTNPNIKKMERPKEGPFCEDGRAEEILYATEESLHKLLARCLNAVLDDETIIRPMTYFVRKGIQVRTVNKWKEKYEFFRDGFETIKDILGERREKRMVEYNPSKHDYILPHYLEEYKEQRDREKKNETDTEQPITVIFPDYSKPKEE